jgi:hypothetical protein
MPPPADNPRQIAMKVHVSDPACLVALARDLHRGGCLPLTVDPQTLEVVYPDASTAVEARTELTFFLRAWRTRYPDVDVWLG